MYVCVRTCVLSQIMNLGSIECQPFNKLYSMLPKSTINQPVTPTLVLLRPPRRRAVLPRVGGGDARAARAVRGRRRRPCAPTDLRPRDQGV